MGGDRHSSKETVKGNELFQRERAVFKSRRLVPFAKRDLRRGRGLCPMNPIKRTRALEAGQLGGTHGLRQGRVIDEDDAFASLWAMA